MGPCRNQQLRRARALEIGHRDPGNRGSTSNGRAACLSNNQIDGMAEIRRCAVRLVLAHGKPPDVAAEHDALPDQAIANLGDFRATIPIGCG